MQTGSVASGTPERVFCRMVAGFPARWMRGFLKRLRVLLTRQEIVPERLPGATVVVLDVFMATTTLLTIMDNGARGIYPVASLEEGEEVAAGLVPGGVLRGGGQGGGPI